MQILQFILIVRKKGSLRSLEVEGTRKKVHARKRRACLPRTRPFSLSPTTSKRLLRRLVKREKQKNEITTELSEIEGKIEIFQ